MEEFEIKKETHDKGGETIHDQREYNIQHKNKDFVLKIEIYNNSINFILLVKNENEYIYKTNWSFTSLANELELNTNRYSNSKSFIDLFDSINEKKNFFVNIDNNKNYILIFKFINVSEKKYEIKFNKNYMNTNDKLNVIFNKLESMKDHDNNIEKRIIEKINIKINELNNKIDKKDKEIKDIINKKDKIIYELRNQLVEQKSRIRELENDIMIYKRERGNNFKEIHQNEGEKKLIIKKKSNKIPSIDIKMREPKLIKTINNSSSKKNPPNLKIKTQYLSRENLNKRFNNLNFYNPANNYRYKTRINTDDGDDLNTYNLKNINANLTSRSSKRNFIKKNNSYNDIKLCSINRKILRFKDKESDNRIKDDENKQHRDFILKFRDVFNLTKESYSDEILLKVLKNNNFNINSAFISLFDEK